MTVERTIKQTSMIYQCWINNCYTLYSMSSITINNFPYKDQTEAADKFDNRGLFREQLLLFCFRALIKAKSFGTFPVRLVTKDLPLPAQRKLNFDQNGCKWVLFGRIIAERSREGGSLKGRIKAICHRYSYQLFWLISWQLLSRVFDRTSLNQCRWRSYWMNKQWVRDSRQRDATFLVFTTDHETGFKITINKQITNCRNSVRGNF